MTQQELNEIKIFCKLLSEKSGEIISSYFRTGIKPESKKDESPVTIADKKAEEIMRELIGKEFPEHGILGEEFGASNPDAEYQWILDPIDGTKSFISGATTFGTLIAFCKKDEPLVGVINQPILNEFMIGDNETTTLNGTPTKIRSVNSLSEAILLTTDILNIEEFQNLDKFLGLARKTKYLRMWGDCYGYLLVAGGFADIMIDPIMNPWDSRALIPVINGAGGVITDYHGNSAIIGNSTVASSKELHAEIIGLLNS